MRNLDQIIGALPEARRAKVTARGRTLIAEEMALGTSGRRVLSRKKTWRRS